MVGRGLVVAALALAADQLSKLWVLHYFAAAPPLVRMTRRLVVTPFFNLLLIGNTGISFGMFHGHRRMGEIVLVVAALAIVAGLLVWLVRTRNGLVAVAIGFLVGGALGNVADRVIRGWVVDFLDFHLGQWHPFVFNLADAAISIGVGLLILDGLLGRRDVAKSS
ncbi:MAG: signal peptidase II [Stellaceae bacterium]